MAETPGSPDAGGRVVLPLEIGAVFGQGRLIPLIRDTRPIPDPIYPGGTRWETVHLVPVLDVEKKSDRSRWALENIRVFSDGTLPYPERSWKGAIDHWLSDLKTASDSVGLEGNEREETERSIKAMMAVSASARAMEKSAGDWGKYLAYISMGEGQSVQGTWREYLLHNDPEKLNLVIHHPLVRKYYRQLLEDAGMEEEYGQPGLFKVDAQVAQNGELVKYLRTAGRRYKGGFNAYIEEVLLDETEEDIFHHMLDGYDDRSRWAAARLACDAFLVDKYTRWEFAIDRPGKFKMRPSPDWDGDPLRTVLEPSFLPRRIKKMYPKSRGQEGILNLLDRAFRPLDIFAKEGILDRMASASMIEHLKTLNRYQDALNGVVGSTQAIALPQWSEDGIKGLQNAAEVLNQIYGNIDRPEGDTGKHILGAMMARIVQCKALASAVEIGKAKGLNVIQEMFGRDEERPYNKVLQIMWGPKYDAKQGVLASWAGGRTNFVFKGNCYGAEEDVKDSYRLLFSADASMSGRSKITRWGGRVDKVMDIAEVMAKIQEVWT